MTDSKSTKRALVFSALAILVCVAMLIGTTFAWFTDSASTAVNRIQAGNLKVGFEYWNGTEYVDATNAELFSQDTLWEPGHTEVVYLKIINKGNLALKYRLNTINTFEFKYAKNSNGDYILLSNYLKIGIVDGKNAAEGVYTNREDAVAAAANNLVSYNDYTKENTLLPATDGGESADYIAFVVNMPTTVGNDANAANSSSTPWIRFNLALNATQASSEIDSFNNEYDKDVPYPISGKDAQQTGEVLTDELMNIPSAILLGSDATGSYGWFINGTTTIDLNGHTLKATSRQSTLNSSGNGNLTVIGNGTVDASETANSANALRVSSGGKATIKGGTFIGKDGSSCIYNAGGTLTIEGGTFKIDGDTKWTLNCLDGSGSIITVKGGTFYKFDPSNAQVGAGEIVVPDGYTVVQNGDWYTVVAE